MNQKLQKIIKNAIDLHVHIGPEIIPRKYSVEKLRESEQGKIRGMVLKNHFYPTTPLSYAAKNQGIKLFGSIVLNNFVGGLNPDAVYAASLLQKEPLIVWFPTINAKQFLTNSKYEIPPEWVNNPLLKFRKAKSIRSITILDSHNTITQETLDVLKMIKTTNSILATGHISWQESAILVKKALQLGITKIIITHPIYQRINMPISIQKNLARKGAKIEMCYSMYSIDKISIKKIAVQIKQIGANNCILTSDVGQKFSPSPSQALYRFASKLNRLGISLQELKKMLVDNPKKLLELH